MNKLNRLSQLEYLYIELDDGNKLTMAKRLHSISVPAEAKQRTNHTKKELACTECLRKTTSFKQRRAADEIENVTTVCQHGHT